MWADFTCLSQISDPTQPRFDSSRDQLVTYEQAYSAWKDKTAGNKDYFQKIWNALPKEPYGESLAGSLPARRPPTSSTDRS